MTRSSWNTDKITVHGYFPAYLRIAAELGAVESFLPLLRYPDSECESVEYRYGLAIVRKRRSDGRVQHG